MDKEEIIEKFYKDFRHLGDGVWEKHKGFLADWWLSKFDAYQAELIKKIRDNIGYGNIGFSNKKGEICIKMSELEAIINSNEKKR